jgi:hypothetical protein
MKRLRAMLTPSNALAVVALCLALGAGAYAAGLKKNSVKSKQIKDGAVTSKELKAGAVFGEKVASGAATGADVADDSLKGADIDEATLAGATAVDAARVNGLTVKKIDFQSPAGSSPARSVLDFPGIFRIDASCSTGGDGLDLTAFTAVDNSNVSFVGHFAASGDEEDAFSNIRSTTDIDFDAAESFQIDNLMPSASSRQHATIVFSTPGGFVATAKFATEEAGGSCKVTGSAIGG